MILNNEAENLLLDELNKTGICGELTKNVYISGLEKLEDVFILKKGEFQKSEEKHYGRIREGSKKIDAVGKCKSEDVTYIIEAKQELKNNKAYEAIGQVLVYEYIYKEDRTNPKHKQENTRKVIVCGKVDDGLAFHFCMLNGIDIIEITDKYIKKNGEIIVKKKAD